MVAMLIGQRNFTTIETWEHSDKSKKAVVLLSQPWCTYCKIMENYISGDPEFMLLSENFYFLKVNASMTKTLIFNGKEYKFSFDGLGTGTHQLALALGGEDLVFPTTVILDKSGAVLYRIPGFLKSSEMKHLLNRIK